MKTTLNISLLLSFTLFISLSSFGQWSQLGTNIQGDNGGDAFGFDVDMNGDGSVIAASALRNDNNGNQAGHAKAYSWSGTAWVQMGNDIEGLGAGHKTRKVALDVTGNVLAVTCSPSPLDTFPGYVRVFDWDGMAWILRGNTITGQVGESFGFGMSLSDNGNILAIGSPDYSGYSGRTRVYEWNGTAWAQRGTGLDGEAQMDFSGRAISLSADGSIMAIGAPGNDAVANQSGHVRVFNWNGTAWIQQGIDLDGTGNIVKFGTSVSLSDDGTRLAVGSPGVDVNGIVDAGEATVFDWNGTVWIQVGQALNGIADLDNYSEDLSLSGDGNTLAVGAHEYPGKTGSARIYSFNSTNSQWEQIGSDLLGINDGEQFGDAIAINTDGSYFVTSATYIVFSGTTEPGYIRAYKSSTASLNESTSIQIKNYPNPTSNKLNLTSPIAMDNIQVLDMTGRIIAKHADCGKQFELDMSTFTSNVYLVNVQTGTEMHQIRVIKE